MFSCMCLWLAAIQSWGENLNGNNFIVSEKRIALRMLLKTSSIEEGTSFVTFFFVIRCVSNFLCFSICFLLFQRAFTFLTPPPPHPSSYSFHLLRKNFKRVNSTEPPNFQSLYEEIDSSLPKILLVLEFCCIPISNLNCELRITSSCWVFWWFYLQILVCIFYLEVKILLETIKHGPLKLDTNTLTLPKVKHVTLLLLYEHLTYTQWLCFLKDFLVYIILATGQCFDG